MELKINANSPILQATGDKYHQTNNFTKKSKSIFSFENFKKHQTEFTIAGGIATAGIIGLSIICKKNLSNLFNKSLKFKNLEDARAFSKTKIIKGLKKKKPYEQLVIIDKNSNTIVAQVKGEKDFVQTDAFKVINPSGKFSIEHGHPTCCIIDGKPAAMPVSFEDYLTTMGKGAEDLIAYDANGKFSMLTRKPNFKGLSTVEIKYYSYLHHQIYEDVYLKKMLEHLPKEFHSVTSGRELGNIYHRLKQNGNLTKGLESKFLQAFNETKSECPELLYRIDRFWKTHADDLGVIYKSNYDYLKARPETYADFIDSLDFNRLFKLFEHMASGNKKVLEDAFLKNDFDTIRKICAQSIPTATTTRKLSKNDFVKYMSDKLTHSDKFNTKNLNDDEVRSLAKLFGTSEDQIRNMDKVEFRRLCIQTHPDRNPNDKMAHQMFIILNKIYNG